MKTFVIGRSRFADIMVPDASVARRHAEVVIGSDGRCYLTDCGTPGGTWRWTDVSSGGDDWRRVRQSFIDPDELIRLGDHTCTLRELLRQVETQDEGGRWRPTAVGDVGARLRGRVERDPLTGEIVSKRV